jgi:hypothetical protein
LPSGWFPDPHGRYEYRWFNGTAWTADVAADGRRAVDPMGAAPLPRGGRANGSSGNGVAVAAIVCGLLAPLFAWMPVFVAVGITLGVLGVVFGIRGHRRSRTTGNGGAMAITGIVAGTVGLLISIVGIVFTVSLVREVRDFLSPGPVQAEIVSCRVSDGAIDIEAALTNHSDAIRSYTVYGVISEPGGVADLIGTVDDVAPGETTPVTLHRSALAQAPGQCRARLVVHGPLPYGYEMERVND